MIDKIPGTRVEVQTGQFVVFTSLLFNGQKVWLVV